MVREATYACESQFSGSSTRKIGNITLTTGSSSDDDFVEFDDLTEGEVLGWVTGSIDTSLFETENSASIASRIVAQAAITERSGTPW